MGWGFSGAVNQTGSRLNHPTAVETIPSAEVFAGQYADFSIGLDNYGAPT